MATLDPASMLSGTRFLSGLQTPVPNPPSQVPPTSPPPVPPARTLAALNAGRAPVAPAKNQATIFNPKTNERRSIAIGEHFPSKDWLLETQTQNLQTYSATPTKEIMQGPGDQLVARTGTEMAPIANPRDLSALVNTGGYQDTRTPLATWGGASDQNASPEAPASPDTSATGGSSDLDSLIRQMLQNYQNGGQASPREEALNRRSAELAQQRFNAYQQPVETGGLALSANQLQSIRNTKLQGIDDQLNDIQAKLSDAKVAQKDKEQSLKDAISLMKERETEQKNDQQVKVQNYRDFQTMYSANPDAMVKFWGGMTPAEQKEQDALMGVPEGMIEQIVGTQSVAQQKLEQSQQKVDQSKYLYVAATKQHGAYQIEKATGKMMSMSGASISKVPGLTTGSATSDIRNQAIDLWQKTTATKTIPSKSKEADIIRQFKAANPGAGSMSLLNPKPSEEWPTKSGTAINDLIAAAMSGK